MFQLALHALKHLPNVETRFYCPRAFLTLDCDVGMTFLSENRCF